jgi:imidazolonepropionase-like amidohydrolase
VVLDCSGAFVMAGFQNNHVHFSEPHWNDAAHASANFLQAALQSSISRFGFTTVVDAGSFRSNTLALRSRIENGDFLGPRILTAGHPLFPEQGVPHYLRTSLSSEIVDHLEQPGTPEQAVDLVRTNILSGADLVKLFTGSWVDVDQIEPMRVDIAAAAVTEAHRLGKTVYTHPSNALGFKVALQAKVDILAHAVEDMRDWHPLNLARLKALRGGMIPTLTLYRDSEWLQDILGQVKDFARLGGQILFGTDMGYLSITDPTEEYLLMSRAGLSFSQILASLTTEPAIRFKEAQFRGSVAPGMHADLVVVDRDPKTDISALASVRFTIREGVLTYSSP